MKEQLLIVGVFRIPPANVSAALPIMTQMIEASRAEPGCLEYTYAEDVQKRGLIHVREIWRDEAALQHHFASSHIARWRAAWASLGIGERKLWLYRVSEPQEV